MNPAPDNDPFRKRVALAIMCFRFGRAPQNPPKPKDKVPVDLSTDLARSVERQILNSAALLFLQSRPSIPFTWKPTSSLDLFKDLNFEKYHALCWLQLQRRLTAQAEIEAAIREARLDAVQPAADAQADTMEAADVEDMMGLLVETTDAVENEEFSQDIAVEIPLEG